MWRRGSNLEGNLHLMQHHIVFNYLPVPPPGSPAPAEPPRQREVWITYPMISHCVLRPSPPASHQAPQIRLRCRDFTFFSFHFVDDRKARDVYESIRVLSCKLGRLDRLMAFSYQPKPPEDQFNGWQIYDARQEYKRLGISPKDSEKGWRISEINKDYKVRRSLALVQSTPDCRCSTPRPIRPYSWFRPRSPTTRSTTPASSAHGSGFLCSCIDTQSTTAPSHEARSRSRASVATGTRKMRSSSLQYLLPIVGGDRRKRERRTPQAPARSPVS